MAGATHERARTARGWGAGLACVVLVVGGVGAALISLASPWAKAPWLVPPARDDTQAPVFSPGQALRTFAVRTGFVIELVASEPVVRAPVAMNFDEDGRLWVVEMQGYMPDADATGEGTPTSRIVVLEDADRDGSFETNTVFLDGLVLPRSVAPSFGGALVVAPPDLLYCRDTDGDGRADETRVLKTGLAGIENPEHAPNALTFGLDGWWHLSQCDFDFRWFGPDDPRPIETRPTPVHGQWGMTQDEIGRFYYTPNSTPLLMDLVPKHLAVREGQVGALPSVGFVVCKDGETWPIRPTPGVNRGYLANVLRPDGTLASVTAACGPVMNRGTGLGLEYWGDVFICEPAGNLVKHLDIEWSINIPRVTNPAGAGEFLASTDERFRPVWATIGPDGFLYIADMYRGLIQHKTYLTPYLRAQVEHRRLETPLECGRIWRVRPTSAALGLLATDGPVARMSDLPVRALAGLALYGGPESDHAIRLLVERSDPEAVASLRGSLRNVEHPVTRFRMIRAMQACGGGVEDTLAGSNEPDVLLHRLAFLRPGASETDLLNAAALEAGSTRPDAWSRVFAALSLTGVPRPARPAMLAALARHIPADPHLTASIMFAAQGAELDLFEILTASPEPPTEVLTAVMVRIVKSGTPIERSALIAASASNEPLVARAFLSITGREAGDSAQLPVAFEPSEWVRFANAGGADADSVVAAIGQLSWPGKPSVKFAPPRREPTGAESAQIAAGAPLFAAACASCHLASGQGSPGQVAPLRGSPTVLGDPRALARVLIHGLEGEMVADGVTYQGSMPAAVSLDDAELAAVMSYIRTQLGNDASPVEPSLVAEERKATAGRRTPITTAEIGRAPQGIAK